MSGGRRTRKDLVALVADADTREGLAALLRRHHALKIREIAFAVYRHDGRDPGCFREAHEYLRPLADKYDRALVVFDRHGCGSDAPAAAIEADVRARLERSGWADRCDVVVVDPELEVWVWGASPRVAQCLGWEPGRPPLRAWLEGEGLWEPGEAKPRDPKAAVQKVQAEVGRRRSARLYGLLGAAMTTRGCEDRSFNRLREILHRWFGTR